MRFPELLVQVKHLAERLDSLEFDMRQLLKELRQATPNPYKTLVPDPESTVEGDPDGDPTLF